MSELIKGRRLSFEFFPPKTDAGAEKLRTVWQTLTRFDPEFFSVTYGAGGSTRSNTFNVVKEFSQGDRPAAPHLSFGGDDKESILELLQSYKDLGVNRIVALRGDMPSGLGSSTQLVHANELVSFIRQHFADAFHLEVAAYPEIHPEASSYEADVGFLKMKFDAGANSAITQLFYNADAYFYFIDECSKQGINQPIYPGIMPITNMANLARFADKSGFEIPRWMAKKFEPLRDDPNGMVELGLELLAKLCERLLEGGAPGLHFYTMNSSEPTGKLCSALGWTQKA